MKTTASIFLRGALAPGLIVLGLLNPFPQAFADQPEQALIAGVCVDCMAQDADAHGVLLVGDASGVLYEQAHQRAGVPGAAPEVTTSYNIGSMTKIMTATAIGQLVDAGKIRFEDPLRMHLPDIPEAFSAIRIEQLLNHTAGLGNYFTPGNMGAISAARQISDLLPLALADLPAFEPGSKLQYSNSGYVVLGAIIEAASGMSYSDYMKDNIFEVAGMTGSMITPDVRVATSYTRMSGRRGPQNGSRNNPENNPENNPQSSEGQGWQVSPMRGVMGTPAGGSYSSARDLYRFARALLQHRLVSEETLKRMMSPAPNAVITSPRGTKYPYGFGMILAEKGNRFGHGGGAPGVNAELRVWLDTGTIVAGVTNLDPPTASQLVSDVGEALRAGN